MTVESNGAIGEKISHQFLKKQEAKPKEIAPCTCDFSRTFGKIQLISRNSDWLIV